MVFGQKIFVILVCMLALFLAAGCNPTSDVAAGSTGQSAATAGKSSDARVLVVTGENFKFVVDGNDNPDILVKLGDKIRIEFSSTDGFHDWVVDEFNARTEQVRPGTPTFVEFIADKKGTFEYYCSVGSHRK